jgi:hypothetical protein
LHGITVNSSLSKVVLVDHVPAEDELVEGAPGFQGIWLILPLGAELDGAVGLDAVIAETLQRGCEIHMLSPGLVIMQWYMITRDCVIETRFQLENMHVSDSFIPCVNDVTVATLT